MFSCFGVMHAIAAERGDGLRPQLPALLKRSRVAVELEAKSSFPVGEIGGAAAAGQGTQPDDHMVTSLG